MLDRENNVRKKILPLQSKARSLWKRNNHNTRHIISEIKMKFFMSFELTRPKKCNDLGDLNKEFS